MWVGVAVEFARARCQPPTRPTPPSLLFFQRADNKARMAFSLWNVLDFLAVFPPLLELALTGRAGGVAARVRGSPVDLRWFKLLRALRVVRVALLAGEMGAMHASSSGRLLASAAAVRVFQLAASVATLLFTTSAVVNVVERIPFHDALYFVITTLTTVGFGDVVMVRGEGGEGGKKGEAGCRPRHHTHHAPHPSTPPPPLHSALVCRQSRRPRHDLRRRRPDPDADVGALRPAHRPAPHHRPSTAPRRTVRPRLRPPVGRARVLRFSARILCGRAPRGAAPQHAHGGVGRAGGDPV